MTVADSIMSRSVTRAEYLWAKIVSRLGATVLVYAAVTIPFAYLVTRYATHEPKYRPFALAAAGVWAFAIALALVFPVFRSFP